MADDAGAPNPGLIARVAQAARYVISGVSNQTWMSPLQPLAPIAPPDVKGRAYDYAVGLNLRYRPRADEPIDFRRLRMLADNCNVMRAVIQRQKELIEAFDWQIKPREDTPGHRPPESKYRQDIKDIQAFLRTPDRVHDWSQWLHILLEEVLVIDAAAIYRRPTRDGTRLWGLEIISGDTITPLIDASGRAPQPPSPAYQQVLKGVPAGDFTLAELIYYPRSPRANRLYGMPPVQWIIATVETFIERVKSQRAYFTEGNLVDAIMTAPEDWTQDQITAWQTFWDDEYGGNVEARRRGRWGPNGMKVERLKEAPLKDEFDEWLARVICYAFSTSPIPFVKSMNRGNMENQQEVAEEGGVATYMAYVKRLIDKVIVEDLQKPELEFVWSEDREFDPEVAAKIDDIRLRNGSRTLNEVRDRNGDDPYPGEIGDVPIIVTATGVTVVDQAIKEALMPPPPPAPMPHGGPNGGTPLDSGGRPGETAPNPAPAPAPKPATPPKPTMVKRTPAVAHVPLDTAEMARGRTKALKAVKAALKAARGHLVEQVRRELLILGKADSKDPSAEAATVAGKLTIEGFESLPDGIEDALSDVAEDAGNAALVQIGVDSYDELTNQIALRAMSWARNRAAELVGKKWVDGELVDNPDAQWAITDSTRDMVRATIANGLADNKSVPQIADDLSASYAFSDERAQLIAHTEIRRANVQGALEGAREARDQVDVVVRKIWLLGQEPCDICQDNADEGAIDLDEDFPSGDDGPPGHPNCYCSLSWDVGSDEDDGGAEA